jgi:multidrug efflux pump
METELADLDGLKKMTGTAAEGYAGVALEFEFGWDKTKIMADVRDAMTRPRPSSRRAPTIFDQRDQLLGIPDHHRQPDRPDVPERTMARSPRTCRTGSRGWNRCWRPGSPATATRWSRCDRPAAA